MASVVDQSNIRNRLGAISDKQSAQAILTQAAEIMKEYDGQTHSLSAARDLLVIFRPGLKVALNEYLSKFDITK